jgi:glucose/arabinose dehydrogenase
MRNVAYALLILAACGGSNAAKDAPDPFQDARVDAPLDAPMLASCPNPVSGTTISTRQIGKIGSAMLATAPPGDTRLFVVDHAGEIRIFDSSETLLPDPFIDLSASIIGGSTRSEQGLLGLAFHPQYASNGLFFVYFTKNATPADPKNSSRDVVARCQRSAADPNKADSTCVEVLSLKDPFSNHNGGMIEFGKDGFLYIGTGDGGDGGDPNNTAQALTTAIDDTNTNPKIANVNALLGKILRIDVDNKTAGKEYGIPTDNPFAAGGGEPEIFAIGLRNPWRWSFDRLTGDMWIGDVGQGAIEEVDVVKAGELKGKNFGWSIYEASACFKAPCTIPQTAPQDERTHNGDGWNAIIGGQVYRGTCYPDIVGTYFYTDNGHGGLSTATLNANGTLTTADLTPKAGTTFPGAGLPASIHEDARGELYETDVNGNVYHIEASP